MTSRDDRTIDTPDWVRDAVFYHIFPDRFASSARVVKPGPMEPWDARPTRTGFKGGDLLGIVEHLDYLEALGINALYLMPVFQSASNHRYHTYDYLKVDPLLGGDEALRELLDACHARGMHVVLDGVFNHASRGFWPFNHVLEVGRDSPYRHWFHLSDAFLEERRQLRAFDAEAAAAIDASSVPEDRRLGLGSLRELGYRAWWDLPALPKLNTDDAAVRDYLLGVAEHWLRFGIDGWRLDVAEEISDDFWREFRRRVKAVKPDAYIVAEVWSVAPDGLRGDMFDALMDYPLAAAILSFVGAGHLDRPVVAQQSTLEPDIHDDDAATFARRLELLLSAYDPAVTHVQLNLLDSHDMPRFLSLVGGDVESLRLATVIQMTLPGAPCIYYGGEIGMRGEHDPLNRAGFPWSDTSRWDHDLLTFFRGIVAVRHAHPVLRHGSVGVVASEGQTIAYLRAGGDDESLVIVNAAHEPASIALDPRDMTGRHLSRVDWPGSWQVGPEVIDLAGRNVIDIPGRSALVYRGSAV